MTNTHELNHDELARIGSVLMGAASADGDVDGSEVSTIMEILGQLVGEAQVPVEIQVHLEAFDAATFDLDAVCKSLHLGTAEDRRALLALVAEVTDADDLHTCDEDEYILQVARAIGAAPEEYADLTMEFTVISSVTPPALPGDA